MWIIIGPIIGNNYTSYNEERRNDTENTVNVFEPYIEQTFSMRMAYFAESWYES